MPVLSIVSVVQEDACEQTAEHVAYFRSLKDVSAQAPPALVAYFKSVLVSSK